MNIQRFLLVPAFFSFCLALYIAITGSLANSQLALTNYSLLMILGVLFLILHVLSKTVKPPEPIIILVEVTMPDYPEVKYPDYCPKCKMTLAIRGGYFCPSCGTKLVFKPAWKTCRCGADISVQDSFCPGCGSPNTQKEAQ